MWGRALSLKMSPVVRGWQSGSAGGWRGLDKQLTDGQAAFIETVMELFHAAVTEVGPTVPRMSVDPDETVSVQVRTGGICSLCWKIHRKYF